MNLKATQFLPVALSLVLGLAGTVIATMAAHRVASDVAYNEFTLNISGYHRTIELSLNGYLAQISALRGFYAASQFVSADEFTDFTKQVMPPGNGLHSILWVPSEDYEQQRLGSDSSEKNTYLPISYINSVESDETLQGRNLGEVAGYRELFAAAEQRRAIVVSAGEMLDFPSLMADQSLVHIIMPYIRENTGENTENEIVGYLLAVFEVDEWIGNILSKSGKQGVEVAITANESSGSRSIYDNHTGPRDFLPVASLLGQSQENFLIELPIALEEVQWSISYKPAPGFYQPSLLNGVLAGIFGLILSFILAIYLYSRIMAQRRIEGRVIERTRELSKANSMLQRQAYVMEQLHEAVVVSTFNGQDDEREISDCNAAAEKVYGYRKEELLGKSPTKLYPPEYLASDKAQKAMEESQQKIARGEAWHGEVEILRKDGAVRTADLTIAPFYDDKGERIGQFAVSQDITDRKAAEERRRELEQELGQIQKMESLGTLAGGIAHEINTPVQYISDNTRFLKDVFDDLLPLLEQYGHLLEEAEKNSGLKQLAAEIREVAESADLEFVLSDVPQSLGQSIEGLERIGEIVMAIKEFSHPDTKEKREVDINQAITNTLTVARNQWKYIADLETELADNLPLVPCFPGELNQVFLNLIVNAAHAIEEASPNAKGKITVTTHLDENYVQIKISDTGTGISEKNIKKIFDPFFTTKAPGKGTGQGLSISHTIITKKHGGLLKVESETGIGTTFIISIPVVESSTENEADLTLASA